MFRLRLGYLISGIATGLVLLFSFLTTLSDGKLHLVFCDVGQGDAAYIRFPDGRDMLVDGGPNDKVLGCLGRHMPFWDREINLVVLTHPQRDHLQGLIPVLERYNVEYFVRSDVDNTTEGYQKLLDLVKIKAIPIKLLTRGERIAVGQTALNVLWPSEQQIALMNNQQFNNLTMKQSESEVLGARSPSNLNDASVVIWLRYGSFDALLTGDADNRVNNQFIDSPLANNQVELLKVPHHGSRTGMSEEYLDWLKPQLAIISVGKNNTYGHPAKEILEILRYKDIKILRTDEVGEIEVVSDGRGWQVTQPKLAASQP